MNAESLIDRIAAARPASMGEKDLQIYLHVPFCASKCHFCDWVDDIPVTQLKSGPAVRRRYVDALCQQIEFWGPQLTALGYRPSCIYWGGGTPTRLDADAYPQIQRALASAFDLSSLQQHTVESTPSDLTREKLAALESIGVDRLSFGVQSFDPDQLRRAGRSHSAQQAVDVIGWTRESRIRDINIDLISGFPDEDEASLRRTMDVAVNLDVTHVSVYSYRATPRTMMAVQANTGVRRRLDLEAMIGSYEVAQEALTRAGFSEYCFNYFTRDDRWRFTGGLYGYELRGDIIGFGAGATSTIGGLALANEDTQLHRYLEQPLAFDTVTPLSVDTPSLLFPMFGAALMTEGGLSHARFEYLTGIPFDEAIRHPDIKAWFTYVRNCGAELSFEADRVRNTGNIHRVYLKNLAFTLNPALLPLEGA